jgi:predicted transcriptional regulator
MLLHINYHIWFKVCRQFKSKYKLSTNCLLVLNGSYVYSKVIKTDFTRVQLLRFVTYYNNSKIGTYITVLMSKGFIIESGLYKGHQLYCLSEKGLQVIRELNDSYDIQIMKFCNEYNIEL